MARRAGRACRPRPRACGRPAAGPARGPARSGRRRQRSLVLARRVVALVVEARLADRARLRVLRQLAQLLEAGVVPALGLVRMAPDRDEDLLVLVGGGERVAARLARHADRQHALDAGLARARDDVRRRGVDVIEMEVGVDHRRSVWARLAGAGMTFRGTGRSGGSAPVWLLSAGNATRGDSHNGLTGARSRKETQKASRGARQSRGPSFVVRR